jgi:hypothetical protein
VASEGEVEQALQTVVEALAALDPDVRRKYVVERSVSCRVPDLDITWSAQLTEDGLTGLTRGGDKAQIRLTIGSDDLLALVDGDLAVPTAVATGRIRVHASPFDLLRLGALI